jgi:hypothetical protein
MATQGIVSIVKDGRVVMKVVAGCDGYYAPNLAAKLRERHARGETLLPPAVYAMALDIGLGCEDCLVVQCVTDGTLQIVAAKEIRENLAAVKQSEIEDMPGALYWDLEKFMDSKFNPRWRHGSAAHMEMVTIT